MVCEKSLNMTQNLEAVKDDKCVYIKMKHSCIIIEYDKIKDKLGRIFVIYCI